MLSLCSPQLAGAAAGKSKIIASKHEYDNNMKEIELVDMGADVEAVLVTFDDRSSTEPRWVSG